MSGIAGQIVTEYLPYAGATAGFVAGSTMEMLSQREIRRTTRAPSEVLDGLVEPPNRNRLLAGALLGPIVYIAAAAGAVNGYAWQSDEGPQVGPPRIEIVVDSSGATRVDEGRPAEQIAGLSSDIGQMEDIDIEALLARAGTVTPVDPSEVGESQPIGDAPLSEATSTAIGLIRESRGEPSNDGEQESGAVVLLTFGNGVGNSDAIQTAAIDSSVPIYVANVEPGETAEPDTVRSLRNLAEATGGEYWGKGNADARVITERLGEDLDQVTIVSEEDKPSDNNNKWPVRAFGVFLLAGVGVTYSLRKKMKVMFNDSEPTEAEESE